MVCCTFFGHSEIYENIETRLHNTLIDLIENKGVEMFFIGNHGNFDFMVRRKLKELVKIYPHVKYQVVLAYLPGKKNDLYREDYSDTIFPDELSCVPPKCAIVKRNEWMLARADYVVTYVTVCFGGAAKFKELAEKKGKVVINI